MADKDIISKRVIRRLAVDLATFLLDLPIDPDSLELIETERHRIEERRADLVARVCGSNDEKEFILHIEIQNDNHPRMPWRMLRYRTDIALDHPHLLVRKYLIYIGRAKLSMPPAITEEGLDYRYTVIDMKTLDCTSLLARDDPDALVLAVLCDFGGREPQAVINHIMTRLKQMTGEDTRAFRDYLDMLEILSENRDLKPYIKEAEAMLTQVDIKKLPSYELGMEKGMEEGMEKGMERGMEKGSFQARCAIARSLFGVLPDEVIADKTGLTLADLRRLQ